MEVRCYDSYGNTINHLTQWDINQTVSIDWTLDNAPSFHFCNIDSEYAIVVESEIKNGKAISKIPNILLQTPNTIAVFVYLEDGDVDKVDDTEISMANISGRTVCTFQIPVRKKPQPQDYEFIENIEYASWIKLEEELKKYIDECLSSYNSILQEVVDARHSNHSDYTYSSLGQRLDAEFGTCVRTGTFEQRMTSLMQKDNELEERINSIGEYDHVGQFYKSAGGAVTGEIFNDYNNNVASGGSAVSMGYNTRAKGAYSLSAGLNTEASAKAATSTGYMTKASGECSFVGGYNATASGDYTLAFGNIARATGDNAIAMGCGAKALEIHSLSLGYNTTASGAYSVAIGHNATAASFGTAIGNNVIAPSNGTVIGMYNEEVGQRLFIIGNGIGEESRSNALIVDLDGNLWTAGNITATNSDGETVSLCETAVTATEAKEQASLNTSTIESVLQEVVDARHSNHSDYTYSSLGQRLDAEFGTCVRTGTFEQRMTSLMQKDNELEERINSIGESNALLISTVGALPRKNLLPYPSSITKGGVTFTCDENGYMSCNTPNEDKRGLSAANAQYSLFLRAGTYVLSFVSETVCTNEYGYIWVLKADGTQAKVIDITNSESGFAEFTIDSDQTIYVFAKIFDGKVAAMIRYASITDGTYEPYAPSMQEQIDALRAAIEALGGTV